MAHELEETAHDRNALLQSAAFEILRPLAIVLMVPTVAQLGILVPLRYRGFELDETSFRILTASLLVSLLVLAGLLWLLARHAVPPRRAHVVLGLVGVVPFLQLLLHMGVRHGAYQLEIFGVLILAAGLASFSTSHFLVFLTAVLSL
jgi:hypothetical protein